MPQTKAEISAYNKQYRINNREKAAAYDKQYRIDNREKTAAAACQRYINNREKHKDQARQYYIDNATQLKQNTKQYIIDNPESCKKNTIIGHWKRRGIIGDLSFIYDNDYLPATNCWVCNAAFKNSFDKCCDHDHSITDGDNVRQIVCRSCNSMDSWKNHSEWV